MSLKGVLIQVFLIEPLVLSAFDGFDTSGIQFIWHDLVPDFANASIVYQLHDNVTKYGSLVIAETLYFAGRSWQFEFHDIDQGASQQQITDGGIIAALVIVLVAIIIVTIFFVRSRYVAWVRNCANRREKTISILIEKQARNTNLLDMVVPDHISRQLVAHVRMRGGKTVLDDAALIARAHRRVALCFIDICDFTAIASAMSPNR
jgi:hypothetical protein